ncbi:hypothetical protein BC628DRAFT_1409742 [Trametes gibbosa]|nr:hypothetical protein BC628DRAFT_1409742 [Trametes gibbosa]
MSEDASAGNESNETHTAQKILSECAKAVDSYRDGTIGKTQAVLNISTQLLQAESQRPGVDDDGSTIQSYLAMLDEQTERGEWDVNTPGPPPTPEHSRSRGTSSEPDEPAAKRPRVDPTKYAWAATEFLLETRLDPSVVRTIELLRIYGEDLTQAKRDIGASASAPEFPETEWANVLTGHAIDLNHVFTGRYTSTSEEKVTEHVGGLEVSFRAPIASKKVAGFGDWLDNYGKYIIGLFGALTPAVHGRVLDFDRAVRKRVGSTRRFLLTDFTEFGDLKIQYIDACGANVYWAEATPSAVPRSNNKRTSGNRQAEVCRNYNNGT